jgi:hypothetical protein
MIFLCAAAALLFASAAAAAFRTVAYAESAAQFVNVSGAALTPDGKGGVGVAFPSGECEIRYPAALDFAAGREITFSLAAPGFRVSAARTDYLEFSILNGTEGFEMILYPMYSQIATNVAKSRVDVYLLDGNERTLLETLPGYDAALGTHSISLQRYEGLYYLAADGHCALPSRDAAGFDLSAATLTVKARSTAAAPAFSVASIESAAPDFAFGEWATLGHSTVTENADGTLRYTVDDKWSDQNNGRDVLFMREIVQNTKGYDVTKPIVFDLHYDTKNTPAVWWGIALARAPFDGIKPYRVVQDGEGGELERQPDSDHMSDNFGIMFQTTTGYAEPYYDNTALRAFSDNGGGRDYAGKTMLNRIEYHIGETGAVVKWNGLTLFQDFVMKRSDFPGGRAYPYLNFIETPANKNKFNVVTVKGINAPDAERISYRLSKHSAADLAVPFSVAQNNGAIVLLDGGKQPIPASAYSVNDAQTELVIKNAFLKTLGGGDNYIYLKNEGGIERLTIRMLDELVEILPPAPEKDEYVFEVGSLTEDARFIVDVKNGAFARITGNGLSTSRYSYEAGEGTTVVLTVKQDFINNLKSGVYTFVIKTDDPDDAEADGATGQLVIRMTEAGGGDGDGSTDSPALLGCRSAAGGAGGALSLLPLAGAAVWLAKKGKKQTDHTDGEKTA